MPGTQTQHTIADTSNINKVIWDGIQIMNCGLIELCSNEIGSSFFLTHSVVFKYFATLMMITMIVMILTMVVVVVVLLLLQARSQGGSKPSDDPPALKGLFSVRAQTF